MKRKYDIGHGCIITDDGYQITAHWSMGENSSTSSGITRPVIGPVPDMLEIKYSLGRHVFYLPEYTDGRGFWLGTKKWASKEEMQTQQRAGLWGKEGVELTLRATGETYFREMMSFIGWDVKAEREKALISKDDELALDYMHIAQMKARENETRFNEGIAFTGRNLAWIMEKIGPWVKPSEIPVVTLTD